jgi:hypothetical protein
MKFRKSRSSTATCFAAIFLVVMTLLITTTVVSISTVMAQGKADPPIGQFGNPNDFRPGPPIPSCNADFNQGPPDDPLKGCKDTPGSGNSDDSSDSRSNEGEETESDSN